MRIFTINGTSDILFTIIEEADSVFFASGESGYDTENGYIINYCIHIRSKYNEKSIFGCEKSC